MRHFWELETRRYSSGSHVEFSQEIINSVSCVSVRAWLVYNCGAGHCSLRAGVAVPREGCWSHLLFLYQGFSPYLPVLNPGDVYDAPKAGIGHEIKSWEKVIFLQILKMFNKPSYIRPFLCDYLMCSENVLPMPRYSPLLCPARPLVYFVPIVSPLVSCCLYTCDYGSAGQVFPDRHLVGAGPLWPWICFLWKRWHLWKLLTPKLGVALLWFLDKDEMSPFWLCSFLSVLKTHAFGDVLHWDCPSL